MYKIIGQSRWGQEIIDEFTTEEEAQKNLVEYRIAYGPSWVLWIKRG